MIDSLGQIWSKINIQIVSISQCKLWLHLYSRWWYAPLYFIKRESLLNDCTACVKTVYRDCEVFLPKKTNKVSLYIQLMHSFVHSIRNVLLWCVRWCFGVFWCVVDDVQAPTTRGNDISHKLCAVRTHIPQIAACRIQVRKLLFYWVSAQKM